MIIIADSGSTKTDWRLVNARGADQTEQTIGLNPHFISERDFKEALRQSDLAIWSNQPITKVYFYGAGITSVDLRENMAKWLAKSFACDDIMVASDLLAAAKAIYGSGNGIVGILGTGSNSGYFDGVQISQAVPPLGHLIGDEGSGNALGRRLVSSFLRDKFSVELAKDFTIFYPDHKNLLTNVYQSEQPAKLLASLVPFIHENQDDDLIAQLIKDEFISFFDLLERYENRTMVGLVGSVAYYFSDALSQIAEEHGINLFKIMKSPIEALTLHHQAEIS